MASQASTGVTTNVSGGPQNQGFRQKISDFGNFLYNSDEKTVLGRNAKSWGQIGVFYLIYYSCLAGFFASMMAVFYTMLDEKTPRLIGPDSLIRQNPGLGLRPLPDVETTLIHFKKEDPSTYKDYVDDLKDLLEAYKTQNDAADCSAIGGRRPEDQWSRACKVDLSEFDPYCNEANSFGYSEGKPCVALKLNRVFGWQPQSYPNNESLPEEFFKNSTQPNYPYEPYHVAARCIGENDADEDNVRRVTYYPSGGFHFKYFPYMNQDGYLSPLVMVRFEDFKRASLIMIECKAYAYNIQHNRMKKMGMVRFELQMDAETDTTY